MLLSLMVFRFALYPNTFNNLIQISSGISCPSYSKPLLVRSIDQSPDSQVINSISMSCLSSNILVYPLLFLLAAAIIAAALIAKDL